MHKSLLTSLLCWLTLAASAQPLAAGPPAAGAIDMNRALAPEPENWLLHGRTLDEQRYSPLDQISLDNVGDLGVAWSYMTGTRRGLEASPIVVDGVMYATGTWSVVYALDAASGREIWRYDPQVPRWKGRDACCDIVNRGVAVWRGRVYVGTLDGRLVAIDAATGLKSWEVRTTDLELPYTITGAPRIVKDRVIIGNGGAEFGVRGYFSAYDSRTGELLWRFYTVPASKQGPHEQPALLRARIRGVEGRGQAGGVPQARLLVRRELLQSGDAIRLAPEHLEPLFQQREPVG